MNGKERHKHMRGVVRAGESEQNAQGNTHGMPLHYRKRKQSASLCVRGARNASATLVRVIVTVATRSSGCPRCPSRRGRNMSDKAIDLEAWKDLYKSLGKQWCDPLGVIKHEELSSERQCPCEDDKEVSSRCVEVGSSLGSTSTEPEIEETGSERDVEGSKKSAAPGEPIRKTMECEDAPQATMDCDEQHERRRAKKRPGAEQKLPPATRLRMTRVSRPGCSQFVPRWTNCSRPAVVTEVPAATSPVKRPQPLAPQLF